MRERIIFFTAILPFLIASHASAGAWTQKRGDYYFKLAGGYLNTTQDIDAAGDKVRKDGEGELRDVNCTAYLEYGITDAFTLVATAPYKNMKDTRTFQTGTALERRWGFGDVEVRMRRLLWNRDFVASVAAGGKIPTWLEDDESTRVPLSTKKVDGDVRLLVGKSLYPFPGYFTGEVGYRLRGGTFSNEWFYTLEGGVTYDRVLIKGFISGIRTFGNCEPGDEVGLIGDQNILKISPGIIYRVTPRVEVSMDLIHIASGCNTTAGNTFFVGVALKR
ncbi:MAG: hypothetical protein J4F39_18630 [Candidatus Latescibacteria bacterium]|nr:hypothetical protein [Candidatus Latescibacterota bacterium]